MNSWTISRRIIVGFAAMLSISAVLGSVALWRLSGVSQSVVRLADNTLPAVLTLRECAGATRDDIFTILQYSQTDSADRRADLEKNIADNRARIDELFKQYEPLILDAEGRRLFEEVKRTRAAFITARTPYLELARNGKAADHKNVLEEKVIPAYRVTVDAISGLIEHKESQGTSAATAGKEAAQSGVRLIGLALTAALLVAGLLAWQIVRSTTRVLRDLATNLDQGATQTASAARQVSAASQTLSSGASEQAASVEETSASLEEISSMIRSTADNAEKAKSLAGDAHAVAQAGANTMMEMTQAMAAIDKSSAEVAKIVKNIDEIAFQTNILALNAAVEAARAGEAGAGFAVVADEVRSLAQRSAAAAKETAEKIEAAIASSRNGSQSCDKVRVSLTQIANKVSSTDSLVGEIATAAREQAQGIEQINTAITQMDQVTQSNSASAEESASAAEELDAQAASLKDMVGRLRQLVGGATTAPMPVPRHAPGPVMTSPVAVFSTQPAPRTRPRHPAQKTLSAGRSGSDAQRKAIPMPGDSHPAVEADDDNFKNF
ncbi:MAG: methyl-accepting chemotaxis protein [Verrucomicrobiia bacterium]